MLKDINKDSYKKYMKNVKDRINLIEHDIDMLSKWKNILDLSYDQWCKFINGEININCKTPKMYKIYNSNENLYLNMEESLFLDDDPYLFTSDEIEYLVNEGETRLEIDGDEYDLSEFDVIEYKLIKSKSVNLFDYYNK